MDKAEPALAPEWLRTTGSVTGGSSSTHHFLSASSHSVASPGQHNRNRTSKSISDFDTPRSPFLDRSSSSNSRRSSSSNGSAKHAYSSFSRSHRERDRDREKERPSFGDHWDRDSSDPIGSILSRAENDKLRRSQSLVTRKPGDLMLRKASVDSKPGLSNNHYNGNGTHLGVSAAGNSHKIVFEKDFPSLANEDRQGVPEIGRVPSPGLTTAVQSLPISNSALIGEGWRSALVEVPPPPVQQAPAGMSGSGTLNTVAGLNMAEALTQVPPSKSNASPQLSVQTQKLDELAMKKVKQLIPVTPTMPKTLVHSSDKSKPKLAARSGEVFSAAKSGQQQQTSSHPAVQSQRVGGVKSDASKTSHGKFLVLKPVWENGSPSSRDLSSPTNSASNKASNSQPTSPAAAPSVGSVPIKSSSNPKLSTIDRKSLNPGSSMEKRPSSAQAQSRKDFLNLMRKKSSVNTAAMLSSTGPEISSPIVEKSVEEIKEVASAPVSPHTTENGGEVTSNGSTSEESQGFSELGEQNMSPDVVVYPDEEEAAFLRSLGWEENAEEDEGLTEEEINAFYQEYMKLRPPLKLCGSVLPKLATLTESQATGIGGASADSESKV